MSLINQMLKDLEKRSKTNMNTALSGLHYSFDEKKPHSYKKIMIAFVIILIVFLCMYQRSQSFLKLDVPPYFQQAVISKTENFVKPEEIPLSRLTGIELESENNLTTLRFQLNHSVFYRINTLPHQNKIIILLDNASLVAGLPALRYLKTAVEHLEIQTFNKNNLKIILSLKPETELKRLDLISENKKYELQLEFLSLETADKFKKPTEEKNSILYHQAEAQAKVLVTQGKIAEALRVLQRTSPPLNQYPDYHAFIAALYQKIGLSAIAAELYKQLLHVNPHKGAWWLGLAIAYETLGKQNEAEIAYTRAEKTNDLNPELRAYIESRIHTTG